MSALKRKRSRDATSAPPKLCLCMTHDVSSHIGARLRTRRRLLGLSQSVLGAGIGVSFQQIQKYECAANTLSAGRLWALALQLGVGMDYFFDGLHRGAPSLAGPDAPALAPTPRASP